MYRSKTNRLKNLSMELSAWLYSVFQVLLSMTAGLIFKENRALVSHIYRGYLERQSAPFWKEYLLTLMNLPRILVWDRFFAKVRRGGLAVRMIYKDLGRTLSLAPELPTLPFESVMGVPPGGYVMAETGFAGGNTTLLELSYISNMVKVTSPRVCLEIGTFNGRTTLHTALNAPSDVRIYTLDLPNGKREGPYRDVELLFDMEKYGYLRDRIKTLYGDSKVYDFDFLKGSVDFVFIDGNHSEDYLLNDTRVAMRLVRRGGLIVWHDYMVWDGVTRGLDRFMRENPGVDIVHLEGTSLAVMRYE